MGKVKEKVKVFLNFLKKHKKKLIIIGIIAAIIIFINNKNKSATEAGMKVNVNETTLVEKKEFLHSVVENGKVYSEDSVQVFAEQQLPVSEILVNVGDKVEKGDIIAKLDSSSITQQIDLKKAQMNSAARSNSQQIKSAKQRLDDAVRNKQNGTNPNVVAAQNAVQSAYDSWQSAEKTYEDFKRSIEQGYNEAIISQQNAKASLENAVTTAKMTYDFAVQKLDKANETINTGRDRSNRYRRDVDYLKSESINIERRLSELKSESEKLSQVQPAVNITELQTSLITLQNDIKSLNIELTQAQTENPQDPAKVAGIQSKITAKQTDISVVEAKIREAQNSTNNQNTAKSRLEQINREIENLNFRSIKLKDDLQNAESEYQKYKAEYEQTEKSLDMSKQEVEQAKNALDVAKSNLEMNATQSLSSEKSRQDMLLTYRNSADSMKKAYENAQGNLNIAIIAQDDEIKSLQTSLGLTQASSDNSVTKVDLEHMNKTLDKTVIKAPISGTITENNMILGQAPTNYVAKIETVERVIIKSQVKEYDLLKVKVGTKAEITSDAVGKSVIFNGTVESINPTPISQMANVNVNSNEVLYEVKIALEDSSESDNNKLIPGMNVRARYILDKRNDVYVISTNSIYQKGEKDFILFAKDIYTKQNIGEMSVTVLAENDYESVVEFTEEPKGLRILNYPDKYSSGDEVVFVNDAVEDGKESNMEIKVEEKSNSTGE